jgi:hypothetical protein
VIEVAGDHERILEVCVTAAGRTDDRERLADDVSALFHPYVRLSRQEVEGQRRSSLLRGGGDRVSAIDAPARPLRAGHRDGRVRRAEPTRRRRPISGSLSN